jgi:hypothetical protein
MRNATSEIETFQAAKARILAEFAEMTASSLARLSASWVALDATAGLVDHRTPAWPQQRPQALFSTDAGPPGQRQPAGDQASAARKSAI